MIGKLEQDNYERLLAEIEKFDNMNWEAFKEYCIQNPEDPNDDIIFIDKNIVANYLRELALFTSWEPYDPSNLYPIA